MLDRDSKIARNKGETEKRRWRGGAGKGKLEGSKREEEC